MEYLIILRERANPGRPIVHKFPEGVSNCLEKGSANFCIPIKHYYWVDKCPL